MRCSKSAWAASAVAAAIAWLGIFAAPVWSQNVKVTPLGSHDGEFCRNDRAMVFEDPDGTRILYDAGRTVRGADDPRLGQPGTKTEKAVKVPSYASLSGRTMEFDKDGKCVKGCGT